LRIFVETPHQHQ